MKEKMLCPAKINLFLEVVSKRQDGYHELDTVMHSVDLSDTVTVEVDENGTNENRIFLTCTEKDLPVDERNIAYKAALAFAEKYGIKGYDINIEIEKRIPLAAGLAGGSADCAGVLLLLERIFGTNDRSGLLELGGRLGADVPFCMTCGCASASGIGEKMTRVEPLTPERTIVIAKGGESVSTAEAYRLIDTLGERRIRSSARMVSLLDKRDASSALEYMYNIFEEVIVPAVPSVGRAKQIMITCGAENAMMSGSGPSVFGVFTNEDDAERAHVALVSEGYDSFICFPVM